MRALAWDPARAVHESALLDEANAGLERMDAASRVRWALEHLPGAHALSSSFGAQAAVSLHMVASEAPSIPVILKSVEWLGADAFGYGVIEGSDVLLTLRLQGSTKAARGDRVHVAPAPGRLHLFSVETGKRL